MLEKKEYNFKLNEKYIKELKNRENNPKVQEEESQSIEKFDDIRGIKTNYIIAFADYNQQKIEQYVKEYKEKKYFFAPVYVMIKDNMYYAEGNVEILHAAKLLGLKTVLCKYGTKSDAENDNKYREIGTIIRYHNTFIGRVYNSTEERIWIVNKKGVTKKFKLDYHLKNNHIDIMKDEVTKIQSQLCLKNIEKYLHIYRHQKNKELLITNNNLFSKEDLKVELVGIWIYEKYGKRSKLVFNVINHNSDKYEPYVKCIKVDGRLVCDEASLNDEENEVFEIGIPYIGRYDNTIIEFFVMANEKIKSEKYIVNLDFETNKFEVKKESEIATNIIDSRSFVIRADKYVECNGHNVENVNAIIDVFDGEEIKAFNIPAYYCYTCGIYYIKEKEYRRIKQYGRLICQILSMEEYKKYKNKTGYMFNPESILKSYGYSVSQKDNLSEKSRRGILEVLIEKNVLKKSEIIDYLKFFIRYHPHAPVAIEKWQSDIAYLNGYHKGSPRYIKISKIISS